MPGTGELGAARLARRLLLRGGWGRGPGGRASREILGAGSRAREWVGEKKRGEGGREGLAELKR